MIIDKITNAERYYKLHHRFLLAFQYLQKMDLGKLSPGEYQIEGRNIYVVIVHQDSTSTVNPKLEAHHKYIDIQYTIEGSFDIGWKPESECREIDTRYDDLKDCKLFSDKSEITFQLTPGSFAVLFPEDAHVPLPPKKSVKKAIVKVLIN